MIKLEKITSLIIAIGALLTAASNLYREYNVQQQQQQKQKED